MIQMTVVVVAAAAVSQWTVLMIQMTVVVAVVVAQALSQWPALMLAALAEHILLAQQQIQQV